MSARLLVMDVLEGLATLEPESVQCVITSPPYWGLRDYGAPGQIGLERTPEEYVARLVGVFREVRRVMRRDATLWLNLGDSYCAAARGSASVGTSTLSNPTRALAVSGAPISKRGGRGDRLANGRGDSPAINRNKPGQDPPRPHAAAPNLKPKDLVGIPWRVAFALQADGWWLRSDIIWAKPNPMPESVTDRPTKSHEHLFLLARSERYRYDATAIAEPVLAYARNARDVWTVATQPFSEAHFATFPPALVEPCIRAGCPSGALVLDPFAGAGTVLLVADRLGRDSIGIELNPAYAAIALRRLERDAPMFNRPAAGAR